MATRKAGDWISTYLEYVKDTEPPTSFHVWTAVSVIAATLQRRVWLKQGHERIFPNMFVVLVGASGRCRKGTAMGLGQGILSKIQEVKISAESVTMEALIKRMGDSVMQMPDPENPGALNMHCSLTIFSEELSVFLRQNDIKFLSHLTNWYDSRDTWTYETKNSGKFSLDGICVNLLGGTAPEWLQSMLPQEAIGGGFTARVIFVVETRKKQTSPRPQMDDSLKQKLISDLEQIVQLRGPYELTPEAQTMYDNWYSEQDIRASQGKYAIDDPRFAGYCDRRQTHIRKLAMVFNASRGNDLTIDADDFTRARELLEKTEKNMPRTFGGLGESRYGQATEKVIRYLEIRGGALRSEILKQFYRDIDPETLRIVVETLVQMKLINQVMMPEKGDERYEIRK